MAQFSGSLAAGYMHFNRSETWHRFAVDIRSPAWFGLGPLGHITFMSAWRRVAIEMLPEFRDDITQADEPMALWVEIGFRFQDAFRKGDEDLVRRYFRYAEWCLDTAKQKPTDASTAAWCAFYEHLPHIAGLAEQLHRFMPRSRFVQVRDAFRYHTSDGQFAHLQKVVLLSYDKAVA